MAYSNTEALFNAIAKGAKNEGEEHIEGEISLKERLEYNWHIASKAGLPANITGIRVKGSTIAAACGQFGLDVPQIAYTR